MAQAVESFPVGAGRRLLVIDQEAAREYESRAKQWLSSVKRAFSDADFAWTNDAAREARDLLYDELHFDWEELLAVVRSKATPRAEPRFDELKAAKDRIEGELANELDLLVLGQDRSRIPIDDQLKAPRYAAVQVAWDKSKDMLTDPQPDYPNAAKEAVSAVEQLARIIAKNPTATLGDLIKEFRTSGLVRAPLLKGLEELWGWASGTPSVRHGAASTLVVDATTARYIASLAAAAVMLLLAEDTA